MALNNLQRLICHKTQQTNKQTSLSVCLFILFAFILSIYLSIDRSVYQVNLPTVRPQSFTLVNTTWEHPTCNLIIIISGF